LFASETVTVYVPAPKPEIAGLAVPFDQIKLNGCVPPDALTVIWPAVLFGHGTSVFDKTWMEAGAGLEMTAEKVEVHPLESVTVTV
jgi:hypothetical protein